VLAPGVIGRIALAALGWPAAASAAAATVAAATALADLATAGSGAGAGAENAEPAGRRRGPTAPLFRPAAPSAAAWR
jgi:hypothetical protein